ncbi:MAG: hypothetical protein IPH44_31220 [Myxococcales bacterium]|nr:hypothetical protein [Myxococcales bacterium]
MTATTSETSPPAAEEGGATGEAPPMILPKGKLRVDVSLNVNLSKDLVAKPINITPDVWYGVAPKLEVGLAHSSYALTGFWGLDSTGGGLCITGEENGCAKFYDGPVGVLAHYALVEGDLTVAADGGVVIGSLDPFELSLKAGVRGVKAMDKLMIGFAPFIALGLTERDAGNKEVIGVPVDVNYMVNEKIGAGVQVGIFGPLDGFGDAFIVPLSLAGMYQVNESITAGASFTLLRVAGGADGNATDGRGLSVFASWHN